MSRFDLAKIKSPIILKGDNICAYRDPAVTYHNGVFHLFCTYVEDIEGGPYLYICKSQSTDLIHWSKPVILTERDKAKNYSSPGNCFFYKDKWYLCLQTYCRENGEKFGNENSRLYFMTSKDLKIWSEPFLIKVKGDSIPVCEMGRMIDPYICEDKDEPEKFWCFYKQNGVSYSCSYDLEHWEYKGHTQSGENVCVIVKDNAYIIIHSPDNGIELLKSDDLKSFTRYDDKITLNQQNWEWAKGRLTAGFVLDLTKDDHFKKYLLFFHGSGPQSEAVCFDNNASIAIAWSDDLLNWQYPL